MNKFKKIIEQNISGKIVLGLFIITNSIYAVMLVFTIPKTMVFSNEMNLLDMMPTGFSFNYVNELFSTLGENGRDTYLTLQMPVDMIYPLLFGITYCLLIAYFLKILNKVATRYNYLCYLPIIAGVSDYFENIGIITMLNSYPDITETAVSVVSMFSIIKSISTSIFFTALIIVLVIVGIRRIKK